MGGKLAWTAQIYETVYGPVVLSDRQSRYLRAAPTKKPSIIWRCLRPKQYRAWLVCEALHRRVTKQAKRRFDNSTPLKVKTL